MTRNGVHLLLALAAIFLTAGVTARSVEETASDVIDTLAHTPYVDWSAAFISTNSPLRGEVLSSTLFIPRSATRPTTVHDRREAALHVVPEKLDFDALLSKVDGSCLPTLFAGHSIRVLNSSIGFFLDGVKIVEHDLYVDSKMAIHVVESPFIFTPHCGDHGGSLDWKGWAITITALAIMCSALVVWLNRKFISC
ncbi:hypothetical protein CARUB_v10007478mg [Capsella rubella]|uniref:FAS1 domain-containing protein n=1 Tax=Capsella rubella TaxID=81985 RepID=R0FA14_9BRAS|nr:hypothetical protein CARUB_v10007478mg [Capsella rubella]